MTEENDVTRSILPDETLERLAGRASVIGTDAMLEVLGVFGSDAKISPSTHLLANLAAHQNALLEELVRDTKKLNDRVERIVAATEKR